MHQLTDPYRDVALHSGQQARDHRDFELQRQHRAGRLQRPRRTSITPGRVGALVAAVATIVGLGVALPAQSASPPETPAGCTQGATYESGCQLTAGHADGWFKP